MKRNLLILLTILGFTGAFVACQKDQLTNPAPIQQATDDQALEDRAKCLVTVTLNYGTIEICGTGKNLITCNTNAGTLVTGVQQITGPTVYTFGVNSPGTFKITGLNPDSGAPGTITTSNNSVQFNLGTGQTQDFFVGNNCKVN